MTDQIAALQAQIQQMRRALGTCEQFTHYGDKPEYLYDIELVEKALSLTSPRSP